MSEDNCRKAMNEASRNDALCYLMRGAEKVIAVWLDSSKGVAILFGGGEVPLSELSNPR